MENFQFSFQFFNTLTIEFLHQIYVRGAKNNKLKAQLLNPAYLSQLEPKKIDITITTTI